LREINIGKNDYNQRLDKFLFKYLENAPQSLIYKGIRKGRIKVNGKKSDIAYKLQLGDNLQLYLNDEIFETAANVDVSDILNIKFSLDVIYEDENILVANKPAGLLCHEDANERRHTLINYICAYLYQKGEYRPEAEHSFAPALCHRIDRNTAGLVIAAKTAEALRVMNDKIKHREIDKFYLANVCGKMSKPSGELTHYLFKDSKQNKVYVYDTPKIGTQKAVSRYKVVKQGGENTLVEVELISGRTHQIRAQFAHIGHPLVGDGKYGKAINNEQLIINNGSEISRQKPPRNSIKHQQLLAYKLAFSFTTAAGELEYLKGLEIEV